MAVITVSRQLGSAGDLVAARTAEFLKYEYVDKTLISEAARVANVPESEIEKYDERGDSAIRRFLSSLLTPKTATSPMLFWGFEFPYDACAVMLTRESESDEVPILDRGECLKFIQRTVQKLYERGNIVIVGRGSQIILRDYKNVLHVRTVASREQRCARTMQRRGVSRKGALALNQKTDKQRVDYIRNHYRVDWDAPELYHLIINTGRTGIEMAARVVADAVNKLSRSL